MIQCVKVIRPLFQSLLVFFVSLFFFAGAAANELKNHHSPYLAMHGNDPVKWMEWGEAALQKARKENKIIFVSVGYFACHWCHVMHRESFSNDEIAKQLNDDYIAVKVDRELSPVLDKRLIEFVTATAGTAGWPLSVFITPHGDPLVGATYLPPDNFSRVLTSLAKQWREDGSDLAKEAKALNTRLNTALGGMELPGSKRHVADNADTFIRAAMARADTLQGGFGEQRKFPTSPQLQALFQLNKSKKNTETDEFIRLTLDVMASKSLHDEIGGGFYRYTVDPGWHTPHFEKMLYNNALLPMLYFDAAEHYQHEPYRQVALETLHFLLEFMHSMHDTSGGFVASLSAIDDKGVEGGYYLWRKAELQKILSPQELKLANVAWGMDKYAELEAGVLPMLQADSAMLARKLDIKESELLADLARLKQKLKRYRQKHRTLPVDHKLLSGWNGLALAAFAKGIRHDEKLKPAAQQLANFLLGLWNGKYLQRAKNDSQHGTLGDYAAVSWGLLSWADAVDDQKARETGLKLVDYAWANFYKDGRWRESEDAVLPQSTKLAHIMDEPIPSPETLLIRASLIANQPHYNERVSKLLANSTKSVEANVFSYASLIAEAVRLKRD